MECPASTGFDTKLLICNYINSLPRCHSAGRRQLPSRSDRSLARLWPVSGQLVARQTQHRLEVGDLGYLTSLTSTAPPSTLATVLLTLSLPVMVATMVL